MFFDALRIFGALLIFMHHYLKTVDKSLSGSFWCDILAVIGIGIFLYLSGVFASIKTRGSTALMYWLKRRYLKISFDYITIVWSIVFLNMMLDLRSTTLGDDILVLIGMTLFSGEPVYAAPWYITIVIFLYVSVAVLLLVRRKMCIERRVCGIMLDQVVFISLVVFLSRFAVQHFSFFRVDVVVLWYVSFMVGWYYGQLTLSRSMRPAPTWLRLLAESTYPFYLMHGPVIFAFCEILNMPIAGLFGGLAVSVSASVGLVVFRKKLERERHMRAMGVVGPMMR